MNDADKKEYLKFLDDIFGASSPDGIGEKGKTRRRKEKKPKSKITKRITLALALAFFVILSASASGILVLDNDLRTAEKEADIYSEKAEFYKQTVSTCFDFLMNDEGDGGLNLDLDSSLIADCVNGIDLVDSQFDVEPVKDSVADARNYMEVMKDVDNYYDENGIVLSNADFDALGLISENAKSLKEGYREHAEEKIHNIEEERDRINLARSKVNSLFSGNSVASNATLAGYNETKGIVDSLNQEDLKNELNERMGVVYPVVEERYRQEQERIRREREEAERRAREYQARVAAAWHVLNIPYISQNNNGVNNGCEAASLLMSLKAKGYASSVGYIDFVNNMPKSNDPNTGFYLDIYGTEPRNEAHWIAPAPLAAYGRSVGGNVTDISGTSVDGLDAEIAKGNPVIIYIVYNFGTPGVYSKGVPRNMHVVVLAGYNEVTGEQVIVDPWTSGGRTTFNVSKSALEYSYRALGYRAVVVR